MGSKNDIIGIAERTSSFSVKLEKDTADLISHREGRRDYRIATLVHPDADPGARDGSVRVDLHPDDASLWAAEIVLEAISGHKKVH